MKAIFEIEFEDEESYDSFCMDLDDQQNDGLIIRWDEKI